MKIHRILITAGGTKEWIDPVRYISNASSGKMGYEIAKTFWKQSERLGIKEIIYIYGNVNPAYRNPFESDGRSKPTKETSATVRHQCISVETTENLMDTVLENCRDHTALVMAAAPLDYKPKHPRETKIKKEDSLSNTPSTKSNSNFDKKSDLVLEFVENPDILVAVSEKKQAESWKHFFTIGFAAESKDLETYANQKIKKKKLDLIVANLVHKDKQGFGDLDSTLWLYSPTGKVCEIGPARKDVLARELVDLIFDHYSHSEQN